MTRQASTAPNMLSFHPRGTKRGNVGAVVDRSLALNVEDEDVP
jgi:hypothetical protein